MREVQYDSNSQFSSLVEVLISRASAIQRMGRAGRVQSGYCYRLYSSFIYETSLNEISIPEIQRSQLDNLALQLALIFPFTFKYTSIETYYLQLFNQFLDPPSVAHILCAIDILLSSGLLRNNINSNTSNNNVSCGLLTALGKHIALLPVSSTNIGRLLVLSTVFGCVTPISIIAALLSEKSIYLTSRQEQQRDEWNQRRKKFITNKSDHLTLLNIYQHYQLIIHP